MKYIFLLTLALPLMALAQSEAEEKWVKELPKPQSCIAELAIMNLDLKIDEGAPLPAHMSKHISICNKDTEINRTNLEPLFQKTKEFRKDVAEDELKRQLLKAKRDILNFDPDKNPETCEASGGHAVCPIDRESEDSVSSSAK